MLWWCKMFGFWLSRVGVLIVVKVFWLVFVDRNELFEMDIVLQFEQCFCWNWCIGLVEKYFVVVFGKFFLYVKFFVEVYDFVIGEKGIFGKLVKVNFGSVVVVFFVVFGFEYWNYLVGCFDVYFILYVIYVGIEVQF